MRKVVARIIRSADSTHFEFAKNALRRQVTRRLQLFVRAIPNARRRALIEQLLDAEVPLQLQVRPVIQRIAQCERNRARPRQKFIARIGGASHLRLGHTIGPHRAPLIVVAFKPRFEQIVKATVGRDIRRRQMRVVIEDRFGCSVGVIQVARRFRLKQKVVVNEGHHGSP